MNVNKPLIFLVEDSDPYRILVQRVLEENGYFVLAFKDGLEAFKKLFKYEPRAIISDIQMPRMDGFQLREATTESFPNNSIPFIYITSNTESQTRQKAGSLGVNDFHIKPLDLDNFMNVLTMILNENVA